MNKEKHFPTREQLDQAFTNLQDQITRITVQEEEEMLKLEEDNE